MTTITTTAPAPGLGGIFAAAFALFGAGLLALNAPNGFFPVALQVVFYITVVPLVLFLGNAVNQRLNVLLFGRELPIGLITVFAAPTVILLAVAR